MSGLANFLGIKPLHCYGKDINSYDIAKFLAIFFMIIDHMGYFFFMDTYFLRGLGRVAFPIFFFLIGYSHNQRTNWNFLIIGIVISVYKGLTAGLWTPFDILVTAFLSKLVLRFVVKKDMLSGIELFVSYLVILLWHIAILLFFSYGTIGIMFAICGYLKRKENDGEPQKYLYVFILLTIISDYFLQRLVWEETEYFKYIFSAVSLFLLYYFMNFRIKVFEIRNRFINDLILFFSRNSLFIYWVHFTIFVTISVFLFPDHYVH